MASAMETECEPDVREEEVQALQPQLGNLDGRTAITVQGEALQDNDFAGWETAVRKPRQHKPTSQSCFAGEFTPTKKHESRYTQAQYVKKVTAHISRAARMPMNIPREESKIIIRPKGGLNTGRVDAPTLTAAIWASVGITKAEAMQDTICANVAQNIIVVSTPDEQRARRYVKLRSLIIGGQTHEANAYFAAPHDTSKGVIHGIPTPDTAADIRDNIIHPGNPTAIEAHRIGESTAVLVLFQGQKVPSTVKYGATLVRCSLYRQHHQVCRTCGKIGHRQDVCPQPNVKVCFACGKPNPSEAHAEDCKPRCKLCNGPHPTGAPGCSNRFKMPYLVKKRRWDHARPTSPKRVSIASGNPAEFPPHQASQPMVRRQRSTSRSCARADSAQPNRATSRGRESRSRNKQSAAQPARRESRSHERATWTDVVTNWRRSKSRTPQLEDKMRALQQANANLQAENMSLKAQVRELKKGQEEILRLLRTAQLPAGPPQLNPTWSLGTAQRPPTLTPRSQQTPVQRQTTPPQTEETPAVTLTTPEFTAPAPQQEEEDMDEQEVEISRSSFRDRKAVNKERESTNVRLSRLEKRSELQDKRLTALERRVTAGFAKMETLLNQLINAKNGESSPCNQSPTPISPTWTETSQPAQD